MGLLRKTNTRFHSRSRYVNYFLEVVVIAIIFPIIIQTSIVSNNYQVSALILCQDGEKSGKNCTLLCERHCDSANERDVDSNGDGLPDPNASDGINEPEFEGAGEGDNNSNGDIDNNGQGNVSQSTPDLKNGIGAPAIAAMAVGGFLIIAAGFLLRRKPKREEEEAAAAGGILGVSGGDDDDLSDLEPQTNSLPSDMVDIKLTDDV